MECTLAGGNLMGDDDAWIIPSSSRCCMETSSAAPDFCFSFSILFWKLQHLDSTFLPFKGRSFVFHCLDTFCFLLFFFIWKGRSRRQPSIGDYWSGSASYWAFCFLLARAADCADWPPSVQTFCICFELLPRPMLDARLQFTFTDKAPLSNQQSGSSRALFLLF